MGRVRRPFKRPSGKRDASLIVIATEGRKTEPQYFKGIKEKYRNKKIHIEIIEKDTNARSPKRVLEFLNEFKKKYLLEHDDELWMVIDLDDWEDQNLSDCNSKCKQKGYYIAVSNPCFEIWLLLHIKDIDKYDKDEKLELLKNNKDGHQKRKIDREIINILGEYNKSNIPVEKFITNNKIEIAIEHAKQLDNPDEDWPNSLGTKVFLLIEKLT